MTKPDTVTVEYFRLWDDHTWDTDFLEIPGRWSQVGTHGGEPIKVLRINSAALDPSGDEDLTLDDAIRILASEISWRDGPPAVVGFYAFNDDDSDETEAIP